MNIKNKCNLSKTYIKVAKVFFRVAIFLMFVFVLIGQIIMPDERDKVSSVCQIYESDWVQIMPDGSRVPVEVPGKLNAERGEVVTLSTRLPADIYNGEVICFRTVWQDVEIYINGVLRQSYTTKDSRPFGTNSALRYVFVELYENDGQKELTYKFSSNSKYAGDVRTIYIGDRASVWIHFAKGSGIKTAIAIFLMFLSLFCIVVCLVLKIAYKKELALNYLAWTMFFCALWMLSESEFRQLIFRNVSIFSSCTYWCLMLIPITMVLYINEIQNGKYWKIYFAPMIYSTLLVVTGTLLQILDIAQFVEQLIFIHIGMALAIIGIVATITIDIVKKRCDYLFVGIGIYGMLFTTVIEIVVYYIDSGMSLGTILALGLLFLLIMAIFKSGQDLLNSEKKRQKAITAREAQAKFLANMSHEIRTPINAVIGMNEMILRENDNKAIQEYALNVQSASNMLLSLINDVLDFSKIESGQLELVEETYCLASLLQDEILLLNARAAGKSIAANIEVDEKLPRQFAGDEIRIKQVITNLLSNAVKYTKEGSITLKAFFNNIDNDTVELCFSIIDTGIGIREEDIPKLFDSFKRLELNKNRNIQGTGLGLNITKHLVELMGGNIEVESVYGKGSTFTVSIPQKIMDKEPIGDLEEALKRCRAKKNVTEKLFTAPEAAVLIVDDNSMNLSLMKGLLKRTQIKVDLVKSGRECLKITNIKKYDIIFMDHMMPDMDGVEALSRLRTEDTNPNRNTIVIALTANAIAGCREKYLEYGFDDYFAKPIQADKLEELIIQYLPKEYVHLEEV